MQDIIYGGQVEPNTYAFYRWHYFALQTQPNKAQEINSLIFLDIHKLSFKIVQRNDNKACCSFNENICCCVELCSTIYIGKFEFTVFPETSYSSSSFLFFYHWLKCLEMHVRQKINFGLCQPMSGNLLNKAISVIYLYT